MALQPRSAGYSTEFSQAVDYLKTIQHKSDESYIIGFLSSCKSIYVYFKPIKLVER